jgi:hypothetical protein
MNTSASLTKFSLIGFLAFVSLFILWNPNHGFSDYESQRAAIYAGELSLPTGIFLHLKRFYPAYLFEFKLIQLISDQIWPFFLFVALQYLTSTYLLSKLAIDQNIEKWRILALLVLITLTPAFANTWASVTGCERGIIFYLSIFIYSYSKYNQTRNKSWGMIAIISANIAIYYKEPVFIAILVFIMVRIAILYLNKHKKTSFIDFILIFCCASFISIYLAMIHLYGGVDSYGRMNAEQIPSALNILNYITNEPILGLIAFPIGVIRLRTILKYPEKADAFLDPLLFAGLGYASVFIALNMYAANYWAPIYLFTFLPILKYTSLIIKNIKSKIFNIGKIVVSLLIILNSIPLALHILTSQKINPSIEAAALDRLGEIIKEHEQNRKVNIFLDGITPELTAHASDQKFDRDYYFNIGAHLKRRGLSEANFDLKSQIIRKDILYIPDKISDHNNYSAYSSAIPSIPEAGDYLLITPESSIYRTNESFESMLPFYEILHESSASSASIPNFAVRNLIKYILIKSNHQNWLKDKNLFKRPQYMILKRK